jgi:hypothetical protein
MTGTTPPHPSVSRHQAQRHLLDRRKVRKTLYLQPGLLEYAVQHRVKQARTAQAEQSLSALHALRTSPSTSPSNSPERASPLAKKFEARQKHSEVGHLSF